MKRTIFYLLSVLILGLSSCYKDRITGEGPVVTEVRNHTGFSGIDLRISGDVFFQEDSVYKVEVHAHQNILDVMDTYVSNNRLVIRFENDVRVRAHEPVKLIIRGPSLNSLRISGSGNITTTGTIDPSSMELDISGSGNIHMTELVAGHVDATISGSGNIKVDAGTVPSEKLRISGSGNIDVGGVNAVTATVKTSGSGDTRVNASQNLEVTITGSGNVYYKGTPVINTSISGSGKVIHY